MSDALDILLREVTEKDILIAKAKQKGWIVDNDNNDIEQNITIVQWYSGVIKNNNMATMDIGTAKLLIDFASSKSANKENNKEIPEDVAIPAVVLYDALTCLESAKYQKRVDILKEHNEKKYSKRAKQSYKNSVSRLRRTGQVFPVDAPVNTSVSSPIKTIEFSNSRSQSHSQAQEKASAISLTKIREEDGTKIHALLHSKAQNNSQPSTPFGIPLKSRPIS